MKQFQEEFERWLNDCLSDGCPSEAVAFVFNLFEQNSIHSRYGIEFVGTSEFDLEDTDWACAEVWEPSLGRSCSIPISFCDQDWETCLARVRVLILDILAADTPLSNTLRSKIGIGLGFVDGDLHLLSIDP